MSKLMKAVVINQYGSAEVLKYQEIPKPEIKSDQMLVKVYATSINPIDWKTRKGMLKMIIGSKFPLVLGYDISGEVVEVGSEVTQFRQGDRIYACLDTATSGSYAEYAAVSSQVACLKPQNITHEQAAAIPLAAQTALQALRDQGQIQPGNRVLINGASGGVGTFAVQLAKVLGAQVTAVCSGKNAELVKSFGSDAIIDYTNQDFTKDSVKYDIIFDAVANRSFWECQNILQPNGVYITTLPSLANLAATLITQIIPGKKAKLIFLKSNSKDLAYLKELIEANKLRPIIARTYPLSQIAEAHTESEKGRVVGKLVITISS
jgi:2-desacetyl-2-hydroxyethyl bacteriochlorophyllide A dehydrogenase